MSFLMASDEVRFLFSILCRRAGCADAYVWGKMWPSRAGVGVVGGTMRGWSMESCPKLRGRRTVTAQGLQTKSSAR